MPNVIAGIDAAWKQHEAEAAARSAADAEEHARVYPVLRSKTTVGLLARLEERPSEVERGAIYFLLGTRQIGAAEQATVAAALRRSARYEAKSVLVKRLVSALLQFRHEALESDLLAIQRAHAESRELSVFFAAVLKMVREAAKRSG